MGPAHKARHMKMLNDFRRIHEQCDKDFSHQIIQLPYTRIAVRVIMKAEIFHLSTTCQNFHFHLIGILNCTLKCTSINGSLCYILSSYTTGSTSSQFLCNNSMTWVVENIRMIFVEVFIHSSRLDWLKDFSFTTCRPI